MDISRKADLNVSQGLSAVLYSLDPEQNKLLEVLLSITIDFYLTKVTSNQLDSSRIWNENSKRNLEHSSIYMKISTPDSKLHIPTSLKL